MNSAEITLNAVNDVINVNKQIDENDNTIADAEKDLETLKKT